MSIAFVTNLLAPKRVQPSNLAFDRPTGFTKPAAMVRTDLNVSCTRCHTPAFCQASSRRQQAVPAPQAISWGGKFRAIPERKTNTMPVSTARSGIGLRPAYWRLRGARTGRSGPMSGHNSSSTSSLGIASRQEKQDRKSTSSRES